MNKEFNGYNGTLILTDMGVIIKKGVRGFLFGGGMGEKTIPYTNIIAIRFKKAGLTAGYLHLTLKGGSEIKGGIQAFGLDENTINFYKGNKDFEEAKRLIEEKIRRKDSGNILGVDELEKYSKLLKKGVITKKEFELKKKQILDL